MLEKSKLVTEKFHIIFEDNMKSTLRKGLDVLFIQ